MHNAQNITILFPRCVNCFSICVDTHKIFSSVILSPTSHASKKEKEGSEEGCQEKGDQEEDDKEEKKIVVPFTLLKALSQGGVFLIISKRGRERLPTPLYFSSLNTLPSVRSLHFLPHRTSWYFSYFVIPRAPNTASRRTNLMIQPTNGIHPMSLSAMNMAMLTPKSAGVPQFVL